MLGEDRRREPWRNNQGANLVMFKPLLRRLPAPKSYDQGVYTYSSLLQSSRVSIASFLALVISGYTTLAVMGGSEASTVVMRTQKKQFCISHTG